MSVTVVRKTKDPRIRVYNISKMGLSYVVLIGISLILLIPFLWMLSTSLTDASKIIVKDREWIPSVQVVAQTNGSAYPLYRLCDHSRPYRLFWHSLLRSARGDALVAEVGSSSDGDKTVRRVVGGRVVRQVVDGKKTWRLIGSRFAGKSWMCADRSLFKISRFAPVWHNYSEALTVLPFHLFLRNTLIITFACIVGQVLSASLVAFGFSRMHFPGRDALFILVLSTMMLPAQVTQIPTFILYTHLQWIDTLKPLIVPAFFGGGAFFIFLLRQFFMTLPKELEDAAKMDGCSPLGIYWNVAVPLSKPALATVAVFSFMAHWNDFMGPLIYIQTMENKTLALGLASFKTLHGTEYHLLMAASIAVLLPVLIIFFSAQKYFVKGIVMSGIKG